MVDRDARRSRPSRSPNWTILALHRRAGRAARCRRVFRDQPESRPGQADDTADCAEPRAPAPREALRQQATYDLIKRELFRRAAQLRGSDQAAFDKLAAFAVVRMENPVMESEDSATGAVNCSGSLSLDLPPGVAAVGGRRTLMSDVD